MNPVALIQRLPKAELHLHIEGTLEPEMMMTLARNAFTASFLSDADKQRCIAEVDRAMNSF